jgi:transcriptional regulator with XRE-family HTH domain
MSKISDFLKSIPDSERRYIKISSDLAAQISAYLVEKGWLQSDLAKNLGKNESEISKWLSGTHNFTVKTLASIENVIQKDLFIIPLDIKSNIDVVYNTVRMDSRTSVIDYDYLLTIVNKFGFDIKPKEDPYTNQTTSEVNTSEKMHLINSEHILTQSIS